MTNCSVVLVKQLALDMNWDGYSSQLSGTAITASERKAGERKEEIETMKKQRRTKPKH
jgi:hypothetical protein